MALRLNSVDIKSPNSAQQREEDENLPTIIVICIPMTKI